MSMVQTPEVVRRRRSEGVRICKMTQRSAHGNQLIVLKAVGSICQLIIGAQKAYESAQARLPKTFMESALER